MLRSKRCCSIPGMTPTRGWSFWSGSWTGRASEAEDQAFSNSAVYEVQSVGVFTPKMQQTTELSPGEVGCIIAGIKRVSDAKIGDTIMDADRPADAPLPGLQRSKAHGLCRHLPGGQRRLC